MLLLMGHAQLRRLELNDIDLLDSTRESVVEGMRRRPRLTKLIMRSGYRQQCEGAVFRPDSYGYTDRMLLCRIESYVAIGGRHPCLTPEEDSYTAMRWYYDMMPEKAHEDVGFRTRPPGLE